MNFCFVILHFLTEEDTIQCIRSIEGLDRGNEAIIVIVDNFSNNGSMEKVIDATKQNLNCVYINNEQNLGFAKGNNTGYKYAKKHISNPCIIILNNDTIIKQKDFITKIEEKYYSDPYAVLGPDIISLIDGGHQNPLGDLPSIKKVKRQIHRYRILLILSRIGLFNVLKRRFGKHGKEKLIRNEKPTPMIMDNQALHGSCLIFSHDFIECMDEAFCSDTFLYKEEFILAKRCEKKSLKMVLEPSIEIYHKEDSSTNRSLSSEKEKREFQFKNLIQSSKIYLKNY